MIKTDILKIDYNDKEKDMWYIANQRYYMLLKKWFDYFGLSGVGLMIGQTKSMWSKSNKALESLYSEITEIYSVDITDDSDIICDICIGSCGILSDFIVCQAVLEHVVDPVAAIRNMKDSLNIGGLIFIHTCGSQVEEHRYPIDCYRFMPDIFVEYSKMFDLKIEDKLWTEKYCYVVYRREK